MTVIADVFPQFMAPKNMVRSMFKKLRFRGPFGSQHGIWSKHCSNMKESTFKYLLITVNLIAMEKFSFSDIQNPKTVC